jgi:hypothetical protein
MAKNPGLSARKKSVQAAMSVAGQEVPATETGKRVALSIRLSEDMYEALRTLAFNERRSQHSLLLEGVEMVLAKHGKG